MGSVVVLHPRDEPVPQRAGGVPTPLNDDILLTCRSTVSDARYEIAVAVADTVHFRNDALQAVSYRYTGYHII